MIHPILITEFKEKCRQLQVKDHEYLIAALMRGFLIECMCTNNKPSILVDSTLVKKTNRPMEIKN